MNSPSEHPELPQALVDDLRALGGVQAPEELWLRAQEQRQLESLASVEAQELEHAPDDLWDRVVAARKAEGQGSRARVLPWRSLQALSAAAAVLVLGVIGFRYLDHESTTLVQPVLAGATDAATKEALRARVVGLVVTPEELSPSALTVAEAFGGAVRPLAAPALEQGR